MRAGSRRGFLTLDAYAGVILLIATLLTLSVVGEGIRYLKQGLDVVSAKSLLSAKLTQTAKICLSNPTYSYTETVDGYTVSESCSSVSSSLLKAEVVVSGQGAKLRGVFYVSK